MAANYERNNMRYAPNMSQNDEIDLLELAAILLAHWWKILLISILGAGMMFAYAKMTYTPKYSTTSKLYVKNTNITIDLGQSSINSADLSASQTLVDSYRELITSHLILDATSNALEEKGIYGYDYDTLKNRITSSEAGKTQMMYISVWDYDPEITLTIMNTITDILPDLAERVIEGSSIKIVDPAYSVSLIPSGMSKKILLGGAAGFMFAAGLILLYYYFLNDQIQQGEWIEKTYPNVPKLGYVPDTFHDGAYGNDYRASRKMRKKAKKNAKAHAKATSRYYKNANKQLPHPSVHAYIGDDLGFFGKEAYNTVRTNVKFSFPGGSSKHGHVIGITSAMPGDGKSYTSLNLTYAMAKDNLKILLIDGDMRNSSLGQYFNNHPKTGLSDILCNQIPYEEAIYKDTLHPNQDVIFAGVVPPNPSELLGSESMEILLDCLRDEYDYIFIDLPPLGKVIDAAAVSSYLDGVIMVARHDYTRKKEIKNMIHQLEFSGARMLGFVYNANVERLTFNNSYYNRYYKGYNH